MTSTIGDYSLSATILVAVMTLLVSLAAVRFGSQGLRRTVRRGIYLLAGLLTVASAALVAAEIKGDFTIKYVADHTERALPLGYKLAAFWAGQSGSVLFWAWVLALMAAIYVFWNRNEDKAEHAAAGGVLAVAVGFFAALMLFADANPFQTVGSHLAVQKQELAQVKAQLAHVQHTGANEKQYHALLEQRAELEGDIEKYESLKDGLGMNPLLQNIGMIAHPPILFLGYAGYTIPFAMLLGALFAGKFAESWGRQARAWAMVAWLFLTVGIVVGSWWAYVELSFGGYWGWDPVEVAALNPWLSGTAFLHSVMIQEKRGLFKRWNIFLITMTYGLVIYGTFLTRSGVFSSVHAFAQSDLGPAFFVFIALTAIASLGLIFYRWGTLQSEGQLTSLLSRETVFLLNNLVFMSILAVCFWGINYPLLSELVTGQKVTMGPPFYESTVGPLLALLLLLMGIAPLTAWGRSTWKTLGRSIGRPALLAFLLVLALFIGGIRQPAALFAFGMAALVGFVTVYEYGRAVWMRHQAQGESLLVALWHLAGRNRRRYGGYIIHLGVVLMSLGVIGIEFFQSETQGLLRPGENLELAGYRLTYQSLAQFDVPDGRNVTRAVIRVEKDGRFLGEVYPRRDYYYESQQPMTIPGLRSTMEDDIYVILVSWQPITEDGATFKVYHNPLVNWLWVGAMVFLFGSLVAIWPEAENVVKSA
jgi:cytochrome c-type biogenesis protein CcmF